MKYLEFQLLGEKDPVAQHKWAMNRDKELKRLWRCLCGKRLPIKGRIWGYRWNRFKSDHKFHDSLISSDYHCDSCTDIIEKGGEV